MASERLWRLIFSGGAAGARHMAVDEALLVLCGQGLSPPTLRLFTFSPPCLSLGRLQQPRDVDVDGCHQMGVDLVRRPTGGGAVLHRGDLCYSLVAPARDPLWAGGVLASCRRIAEALAAAMVALGARDVVVAPPEGQRRRSAACFATTAPGEVMVSGFKAAGSAQRRSPQAVLQQGSIPLREDAAAGCLLGPGGLSASPVGLSRLLGRPVEAEAVGQALVAGFTTVLGLRLLPGDLTPVEEALARRLEVEKYRGSLTPGRVFAADTRGRRRVGG